MRERGVQSRRVKAGPVEPARRSTPPKRNGVNFWQALAIIALIAATAGWTTVGVLALRPAGTAVATDSSDPNAAADDSDAARRPEPRRARSRGRTCPTSLNGTALDVQSVTGDDGLIGGDEWSTAMTKFLTAESKQPADLGYAFASDPTENTDISIGVYRVNGVDAAPLHDALVEGWKGLAPTVKVSDITLGGKKVTKGDDGTDYPFSYLYVRDNVVYEIYTSDESIATAALAALPVPGASSAPAASSAPSSSAAPSAAPPRLALALVVGRRQLRRNRSEVVRERRARWPWKSRQDGRVGLRMAPRELELRGSPRRGPSPSGGSH